MKNHEVNEQFIGLIDSTIYIYIYIFTLYEVITFAYFLCT